MNIKKIGILAVGAMVIFVLPLVLFLISRNQDTRSGASNNAVVFSFHEAQKNVPLPSANPNTFTVEVHADPSGNTIETFAFTVKYPKNLVTLVAPPNGFVKATGISKAGENTPAEDATYKYYSFAGYATSGNISGNKRSLGTLTFSVNSGAIAGTTIPISFSEASAATTSNNQTVSLPTSIAATGSYTIGSGSNNSSGVNFFFDAPSTATPNQIIDVAVKLSTTTPITAVDYTFTYPANKLQLQNAEIDFVPSSKFETVVDRTQTAGQYRFTGSTTSNNAFSGANQTIATIKLKVLPNVSGTASLNATDTSVSQGLSTSVTPKTITIGTSTSTCIGDDRPASCTCTEDPDCATGLTCQGTTGSKTCKTPPTGLTCGTPSIPPATGFAPLTVSLHGGAGDGVPADSIAGYQWDFDGNGSWDSTTQKEPITHIYTTAGTFNPKFRIQSTNGSYSTTCAYPYSVVATASQTGDTGLRVSFSLPGIGPRANQGENPTPKRANRQVTIMLYNSSNQPLASGAKTGTAAYNPTTGVYNGVINLGANFTTGNYIAKIKVDNSLYKRLPGIVNITSGSLTNNSGPVKLVTGDIDQNNSLTVIDYTDVAKCYQGSSQCTNAMKPLADTNDNGITEDDIKDFVIMQSGFATREGD